MKALFPLLATTCWLVAANTLIADEQPFLTYLSADTPGVMVAYTPSELDPRNPVNHEKLTTASIRADLAALRPTFDGLVLYGYDDASTPRIVAVAAELKYRAVLLGIWQPKLADEVDGVVELANQFRGKMAVGICIGNEGIAFGRYEEDDIKFAANRLRRQIPPTIPLATSEPHKSYQRKFFIEFGDFLAPNLHPFWEEPDLTTQPAVDWVRKEASRLARESGKPVLVKETGVPHSGKEGYTRERQAEFWSAYVKPGLVQRVDGEAKFISYGVAFEAYDLPWKSEASGFPVEKAWGLLSPKRDPHPALKVWSEVSRRR